MIRTYQKRQDFLTISKNGKKWICRSFVILLQKTQEQDQSEPIWGFTASKKIGKAVKRNRAKRRMRAVARHYADDPRLIGKGISMIAREAVLTASFEALLKEFDWALGKLMSADQKIKGKDIE